MAVSTLAIYLLTDNEVVRKPLDTWLLKEVLDSSKGFLYIGVHLFYALWLTNCEKVCLVSCKGQ